MSNFPHLSQLFGGYFHQDWALDDPDWQTVVARFRADVGMQRAKLVADELRDLLARVTSDERLSDIVYRELHSSFDRRPDLGGPTLREWLEEVHAELMAW